MRRLRAWFEKRDAELDREVEAHLELEAEEREEAGLTAAEARYAARRAFGNTTAIQEDTRATWGWAWLERPAQDLRFALRGLRKSPGFSLVAVGSLALGIGANTAIFTFVNAALLKPLPYPNAERIVALTEHMPASGEETLVHPQSFVEWRKRARSFDELAIAQGIPVNTQGIDGAEQVSGMWATAGLFRVLGVEPMLGRAFSDGEGFDRAATRGTGVAAVPVAILSHGYWQRRFGSDPGIVGKPIPVGHGSTTVVGVMPPGFRVGSTDADVYLPLPLDESNPAGVGSRSFQCFGLLRPSVSLEQARAEMRIVGEQAGRDIPALRGWTPGVTSLRDSLVRDNRAVLLMLAGVTASVLLIACANLAALLLTRGMGRQSEMALRTSLGAGRWRLVQQALMESFLLSALGGALGLSFGWLASRALLTYAGDAVAFGQMGGVQLDLRVLGFTAATSLLTAVLFGLTPALRASRPDLHGALKQDDRGGGRRGQQGFRNALVIGETALAVVLLVGAGLLLRTLSRLLDVRLGFEPAQAWMMRTFVTGDPAQRSSLVESILDRVETLPEAQAAGTIQFLPLSGWTNDGPFHFVGQPAPVNADALSSDVSTVSRGYFEAMGIPLLRGRAFERRDGFDSSRVALVNQAFVDKYCAQYCPGGDPIDQVILGDWANPKPTRIIGVAGDVRHNGLAAEPHPTVFLAQAQVPGYITYLVVRTAAPERVAAAIRREVRDIDPTQPLTAIQPMAQYVAAELERPRLHAALLGLFASLALGLAAIGLYGLMAYAASRRTHEIGIRLALGAQPKAVLRSMLAQGARLAAAGLAIGLACSVALRRAVANLLYGVSAGDFLTYVAVTVLLGVTAVLAAYLPARRAAKVDPMVALRHE